MNTRHGITLAEIAEKYGRSYSGVKQNWSKDPRWPAPIGKRGRSIEYDPDAVDKVVKEHFLPPVEIVSDGEPDDLLTLQEIAALRNPPLAVVTLRAYRARGQWPEPDEERSGTPLWRRDTALAALAPKRRRT